MKDNKKILTDTRAHTCAQARDEDYRNLTGRYIMTLTQFVQAVAMMRHAQRKKLDTNSTKWITQTIRTERLVDQIIEEFFKEQTKNLPTEGNLFPPS